MAMFNYASPKECTRHDPAVKLITFLFHHWFHEYIFIRARLINQPGQYISCSHLIADIMVLVYVNQCHSLNDKKFNYRKDISWNPIVIWWLDGQWRQLPVLSLLLLEVSSFFSTHCTAHIKCCLLSGSCLVSLSNAIRFDLTDNIYHYCFIFQLQHFLLTTFLGCYKLKRPCQKCIF